MAAKAYRTGERKQLARHEARPIRWPNDRIEQRKCFDLWHSIAMKRLHEDGGNFQTLAVFHRAVTWRTGSIRYSNSSLAKMAGGCTERTIIRHLKQYEALGLVQFGRGWRHSHKSNRPVETREIRLTYPGDIAGDDLIPEAGPDHPLHEEVQNEVTTPVTKTGDTRGHPDLDFERPESAIEVTPVVTKTGDTRGHSSFVLPQESDAKGYTSSPEVEAVMDNKSTVEATSGRPKSRPARHRITNAYAKAKGI